MVLESSRIVVATTTDGAAAPIAAVSAASWDVVAVVAVVAEG